MVAYNCCRGKAVAAVAHGHAPLRARKRNKELGRKLEKDTILTERTQQFIDNK